MFAFKYRNKGFTLIELLVVIAIIGILATLIVANFGAVRSRARDAKRKSDFKQLKSALRLYYNDYQTYPAASAGNIYGCGADGTSACAWGGEFGVGDTVYMKQIPVDSLNTPDYAYTYEQTDGGDGFLLQTTLENASDEESENSQLRCGVTADNVEEGVYMVCED